MFEQIKNSPPLLLEAELVPMQGERFQPTGFPDIGAAEYTLPDGTRKILVESAQSMANRLEKVCMKGETAELNYELSGLPYVLAKIIDNDKEIGTTSSLFEAHRLNIPYILDGVFKNGKKFSEVLIEELGIPKQKVKGKKSSKDSDDSNEGGAYFVDFPKVARTIFKYDPNSLVHGFFLPNLSGGSKIRFPRALSGFIEAEGVEPVLSGGVKFDKISPTGKDFSFPDLKPG